MHRGEIAKSGASVLIQLFYNVIAIVNTLTGTGEKQQQEKQLVVKTIELFF
jgi:hypothetical protein